MPRSRNTDRQGQSFTEETQRVVWNRAEIVPSHNPDV
jgi:hypothetical protein